MAKVPFEVVLETHGPALARFCASQVGCEHAEDCFQETVLAALRSYDTLRDVEAVRSWLFAIAARKAVDHHRARRRGGVADSDIDTLAGSTADVFVVADPQLWAAVAALPARQRQAVALRYLADLRYREIGAAMGTSEAAARRAAADGLRTLRRVVTR